MPPRPSKVMEDLTLAPLTQPKHKQMSRSCRATRLRKWRATRLKTTVGSLLTVRGLRLLRFSDGAELTLAKGSCTM